MRKHIRKPMLFLAAFLAIALAYFLPGQGTLAHAEGEDAGGTRAEAKAIELEKTYSETTDRVSDEDFFQFTCTKRGYFKVNLKHNAADRGDVVQAWRIKVLDQQGNELTSGSGIVTSWTSVAVPYAEAGRVFYVQVMPDNGMLPPVGCVYDLTVNQIGAADWELESNNTRANANAIEVNKTYHGITSNGYDVDVFQFKTSVQGYFQIQFGQNAADGKDAGQGWEVSVLDDKGEAIAAGSHIKKTGTV